jgi:hypothetical protein
VQAGVNAEAFIKAGARFRRRGVAQLVARTAGGREVAGSNPVTPTRSECWIIPAFASGK